MKCIKDYRRHGSRYDAGKAYDISDEKAKSDEAYLGNKLWEGGKKASKDEKSSEKTSTKKAPAKKTTKKSK